MWRRARELGKEPLAYCDGWSRSSARSGARSTSRSTISSGPRSRGTRPRSRRSSAHRGGRRPVPGDYEGWYCVGCEAFKQEKDLVDGLCPIHRTSRTGSRSGTASSGSPRTATACWRTSPSIPDFVQPEVRRNEILRLLEAGLEDISISRAGQSWGIPLPFDPGSVVYVWFDALINYASAVGLGTMPRSSRSGGPPTCT